MNHLDLIGNQKMKYSYVFALSLNAFGNALLELLFTDFFEKTPYYLFENLHKLSGIILFLFYISLLDVDLMI